MMKPGLEKTQTSPLLRQLSENLSASFSYFLLEFSQLHRLTNKPVRASAMRREKQIVSEEKLEFTRSFLIYGNLALLAWIFIAFAALWFYSPLYGWLFFLFTAASVYLILRRLGCSSCYYCKACTSGFGRLSAAFFGTGYTKKGSVGNRHGLIVFIYFLLAPLPMVALASSLLQEFSVLKLALLAGLAAFTVCSGLTWRRSQPRPNKSAESV